MPMFATQTPTTNGDLTTARKASKLSEYKKPIGDIGVSDRYQYGFDGDKYYVTEGFLCQYVTQVHLSLDEAKHLFNALNWVGDIDFCYKLPSKLVKEARKKKINGDSLFWFFVDSLEA